MISQAAEYALRAVVYLAENAGIGQTTEQIAKATKIPGPIYLRCYSNYHAPALSSHKEAWAAVLACEKLQTVYPY